MPAATSSPVPGGNNSALSASPSTPNGSVTPQRSPSFDLPKQSLRGIKKPKCIKCGNIARSRYGLHCPFLFGSVVDSSYPMKPAAFI